mgnify:CR=1 FL=1
MTVLPGVPSFFNLGLPKIFFIPRLLRMSSSPASEYISPASDITFASDDNASSEYPPSSLRLLFQSRAMCIVSAAKPASLIPPWFSMTCRSNP